MSAETTQHPTDPAAWLDTIGSLRQQVRLDDADRVAEMARQHFQDDPGIWVAWAATAQARRVWPVAVARWEQVRARFPPQLAAYVSAATALCHLRRFDEAEALTHEAQARFPRLPAPFVAGAWVAHRRAEWAEAAARWQAVRARFPRQEAGYTAGAVALRELGQHDAAEALQAEAARAFPDRSEPAGIAPTEADRAVALAFESLGGGGHGCEFGIFQRALGAEPLGLLRWADIRPRQLCEALETGFSGVGEPDFTRLFVHGGEYWTSDHRYHMAMRCFIRADDVPEQRMHEQAIRRLRYLRGKLLADLREADKIFVYRNLRQSLTDAEIARLHAAVRRHGEATLLCLRYQDATHPRGRVEAAAPGLLVGYLDRFSHDPATGAFLGHVHGALLALCRKALHMRDAARA